MNSRWQYHHAVSDDAVECAAADYARLLYANREVNRALLFEWSREWLREVGIDETNPATLFKVGYTWMNYHLTVAKFISMLRVVADGP